MRHSAAAVCVLALVLALALGVAQAHICMWHPMQRSNFSISEPGSDPCYRKPPPCGGVAYNPNGIVSILSAGDTYTVNFQQNLNHFYTNNPGFLEISIANGNNPAEGDFHPVGPTVADYNAMNMVTQTNFSITITVPDTQCENCVLRARYLSNNPDENDRGEVFHQCADIKIRASKKHKSAPAPAKAEKPLLTTTALLRPAAEQDQAPAQPCCTMQQWTGMAYETGSWRHSTFSTTYYDAVNSLMRVDTHSGDGVTIYDGSFAMYMNFTSGIEYYLNLVTNECEPLGLDFWNDWCYGTVNETETWERNVVIGDTVASLWKNGDFHWAASVDGCVPVLFTRESGAMTVYYNITAGIADPSVFTPPPNCHLAAEKQLASAGALKPAPKEHAALWKHPSAHALLHLPV